jgi:hypothetical protein
MGKSKGRERKTGNEIDTGEKSEANGMRLKVGRECDDQWKIDKK